MKLRWRLLTVLALALVLIAGPAYAQQIFRMQADDTKIEVLSPAVFEARFGKNRHIPRTEQAILALAQKLYPHQAFKQAVPPPPGEIAEECGEEDLGVLFAALQNPAVSDATRMLVDDIIAAARPVLPKRKVSASGHFKIYYTKNDPDPRNNVTDAQINSLANILDSLWEKYATNFKKPRHFLVGNVERINVYVYYISNTIGGSTASNLKYINLNSVLCVRNACKRRTTAAHELFHRVQYAYGYESGTADTKWITEGTAAWSQKYAYPVYRDYMERMNSGLDSPSRDLIAERAYDACHFWVFLQRRANWTAIKEVWAQYEVNGKDAKAAVDSITKARFGWPFDTFAVDWALANYIKDMDNATTGGYNYLENDVTETSCGVVYGPLSTVPVTEEDITTTSPFGYTGSVGAYGAHYYVFNVGDMAENLSIQFKGTVPFSWGVLGIKNNAYEFAGGVYSSYYEFSENPAAKEWDKVAVVVTGTTPGTYDLNVGPCLNGVWIDDLGVTWVLKEGEIIYNGEIAITGTRDETTTACGVDQVTGWYVPPFPGSAGFIELTTGRDTGGKWPCCRITWRGNVTDCNTIVGTWDRRAEYCGGHGSFSMTKAAVSESISGAGPVPSSRKSNKTR